MLLCEILNQNQIVDTNVINFFIVLFLIFDDVYAFQRIAKGWEYGC